MSYWDWEFFEAEVKSDFFVVTDHGPLFGPVTNFKIERNKALDLVLETTSARDSTSNDVELPAGTVYTPSAEVKLESCFGSTAVATGVIPRSYARTSPSNSTPGVTKQTSSIHSLQWTRQGSYEPCYIIEWVENMSGSFIWPHSDVVTESGEERRKLHSSEREIVLSRPIDSREFGRSCVHLVIDGLELFVGKSRVKMEHITNPGFILYVGVPNEGTRSKIRDCLSFCLGNFLVYLGDTSFDFEWHPVTFSAKSGHTLIKDAPKLSGWQPAPLGLRYEFEITPELLGRMVSSLFRIYDSYCLQSIFWSYWHALAAPVHMAAAHYGSTIEGLQKAFIKASGSAAINKIVEDKQVWKDLRGEISACINEANLSDDAKKILINKVQNLNIAPQSVSMVRFFNALSLKIGTIENEVWRNRNHAAHGGNANQDNALNLIKGNKVLLIIVHRILLALGNGGDFYYDYYSLGRPTIRLTEPIQDHRLAELKS
jgi:hypothetical protein